MNMELPVREYVTFKLHTVIYFRTVKGKIDRNSQRISANMEKFRHGKNR